jgi:hypothetical protein
MLERIVYHNFGSKDFQFNNLDLEFNQINIFTGTNGSGKSFIFKSAWFASTVLNIYKTMMLVQMPDLDDIFEREVNLIFDLTFHRHEELDGVMQITDKEAEIFVFTLAFNEGKLDHFQLEVLDIEKFKVGDIQSVKYNSKEARTFEMYDKYLKTKELLGVTTMHSNADFKKLGEWYRLYDMMWFEQMKSTIDSFEKHPEKLDIFYALLEQSGASSLAKEIDPFKEGHRIVAKDGYLYDRTPNGDLRTFSLLSSGEQAILMMILFTAGGGN